MKTHKYIEKIDLSALKSYCIVMKTTIHSRASASRWAFKPDSVETIQIDPQTYYNHCDAIPFFQRAFDGVERATFGHTYAGLLVTKVVSVNPERTTKVTREFTIVDTPETARNVYGLMF